MPLSFPRAEEIPYRADTTVWLAAVRDYGFPVMLDSGGRGRVEIIGADPGTRLITRGALTRIVTRAGEVASEDDPFDLVRGVLGRRDPVFPQLPFEGGAIGYFGYDLGRRIERLPVIAQDDECLPEMFVGIYDWAVVVDHVDRRAWLVGQGLDDRTAVLWDEIKGRLDSRPDDDPPPLARTGPVSVSLDRAAYETRFGRIRQYIRDGDCYQVNFAMRFGFPFRGDSLAGYRAIRELNPSPHGAYLETDEFSILSFSPERFLRVRDGRVVTSPIKGTRPRGRTPEEDRQLRRALLDSEKDRAENLMIVDLLRNDLGRVCEPGSIQVDRLFELESFATVHHLVSTIHGQLRQGEDALSLLRACFPGGSITGAPKIRAMEIIEEIEGYRRGVYCGSIGYIGFDGDMDTSIAIRTLVNKDGRASFWAGGGVVADSTADAEYEECFDKAGFLLRYFDAGNAGSGGAG